VNSIFLFILVLLILALPIRIAAYLFKAENGTWLRSVGVLFFSAALVAAALAFLPSSLTSTDFLRAAVTFVIVTGVCTVMLGTKLWQGVVLAVFLSAVYSFGGSPDGNMRVTAHIGFVLPPSMWPVPRV
jgi:hypothetical protein